MERSFHTNSLSKITPEGAVLRTRKFSTCSNNNLARVGLSRTERGSRGLEKNTPYGGPAEPRGILLSSYLAGLFEGDGHISISKPGSKSNNLSLSITFHLKDLPLAVKLKEVIGFG